MNSSSTLPDRIVDLLRNGILSGELPPGRRLNESKLARELEVSRAPIREALRRLQEQGLVMSDPRRGMFVVSLEEEDLQKINSLRIVLEAEALKLARMRMTPAARNRLRRLILKIEKLRTNNPFESIRVDMEFHQAIWQLSGNEYLERMLTGLTAPLFAYAVLLKAKRNSKQFFLDSHQPLLDFILGESTESAEELMCRMLKIRWTMPDRFSSLQADTSLSSQNGHDAG